MNLAVELARVTDKASYLQSLNVIDVNFMSGHSLELFVASSSSQKIRGLGNLEHIPTQGMLFYYPVSTYKPFTMKDMAFDLDIGWFDREGKLLDVQSHSAYDPRPIVTARKYNYVIEAISGMLPFSDLKLD